MYVTSSIQNEDDRDIHIYTPTAPLVVATDMTDVVVMMATIRMIVVIIKIRLA